MKKYLSIINIIIGLLFIINTKSQTKNYLNVPSDITPPELSIAVGSIPGAASVNAIGAATYSIPIDLTPGTAGMTPQISLEYNSMAGNGIMGIGWSLGGISTISRKGKDRFNDGDYSAVAYTTDDRLCLDGQRLILKSGSWFGAGSQYCTQNESYQYITYNGTSFTILTSQGDTIYYGLTPESRQKLNATSVLTWYISKVADAFGNSISYTYEYIASSNEVLLNRIEYTRTRNFGAYNQIQFAYTNNRPDYLKAYYSGIKYEGDHLLNSISIYSNGQYVKNYQLGYITDDNNDCYLSAVFQSGTNGAELNPTRFYYDLRPNKRLNNIEYNEYLNPMDLGDSGPIPLDALDECRRFRHTVMDLNGDGKSDLASIDITNQNKIVNIQYNEFTGMLSQSIPSGYTGFIPIDYDGDGQDELLIHKAEKNSSYFSGYSQKTNLSYYGADSLFGGNGQFILMKFSNGSILTVNTSNNYGISGLSNVYYDLIPGDFDGNGMMDLFFVTPGGSNASYKLFLSEIVSNTVTYVLRSSGTISFNGRFYAADFNGDGKQDILNKGASGMKYNCFSKISGTPNYSLGSWITVTATNSSTIDISLGNINNDASTDILDETNNNVFFLTGGSSPVAEQQVNTNLDGMSIMSDFNFDGKDDFQSISIISSGTPRTNISNTFCVDRYCINGNVFRDKVLNANYGVINQYLFGDFNGDGFFENVIDYAHVIKTRRRKAVESVKIFSLRTFSQKQVIGCIVDGLGNETHFVYGNTTTSPLYSQSETNSANTAIKSPNPKLLVVDTIRFSNGIGGYTLTSYRYENARVHIDGKGFLGFGRITNSNQTTGLETVSEYTYDNTYYEPLLKSTLIRTIGTNPKQLSKSNYGYKNYSWGTNGQKHYVIYPDTTSSYDLQSMFKHKTTYTFNTTYGNFTSTVRRAYVIGTSLTEKESVTVDNTYESFLGGKFYRLKTSASTTVRPSITASKAKKSVVYLNSNCSRVSQEILYYYDPATGDEDADKDTISYTYTLLGNVNKVTSQLGNIKRMVNYQFDGKERFNRITTDPLGYSVINEYDDRGLLLSTKDPNNVTITRTYNGLGRLLTVNNPDASDETNLISWIDPNDDIDPLHSVYYQKVTVAGKPDVITYFDRLGRALRTVTVAQNGKLVFTDVVYNEKGQQVQVSLPYFKGTATADINWQYMTYYDDGRLKISYVDNNIKKTTYTYDKNKVTRTLNNTGQIYTQTYDPTGVLIEATDPGGTIKYEYYSNGNLKSSIAPACTTTVEYDKYNTRKKIIDSNAGTIQIENNAYGEVVYQKDARGNWFRHTKIDKAGRPLIKTSSDGSTVNYVYDTDFKGTLYSVSHSNGTTSQYSHNAQGLVTWQNETIGGTLYQTKMEYDSYSRIQKITYPSSSDINVSYAYTTNGYLSNIKLKNNTIALWSAGDVNAFGEWKNFTLGSGINRTFTYNAYGMPDEIKTNTIQSLKYDFNIETGNLTSRKNILKNLTETFTYNNLDQLTSWNVGTTTYALNYRADGTSRINTKTDAGTYVYGATPAIHRVTGINNNPGTISNVNAAISYNSFNKIASISETGAYRQDFTYAADEQRRVSKLYNSSNTPVKETIYVPGGYEIEKRGTKIRQLHYIPLGDCWALYTKNNSGVDSLYFILADHLGSAHIITNSTGSVLKEMSFDPWGRRRNPNDWTYNNIPAVSVTTRGYTMHEHMDQFKLINMNGRVYDPVLAQFLSPDPIVADAGSTMSYNRYAYCNYNPLKYVDPSGYIIKRRDYEPWERPTPYFGSHKREGDLYSSYLNFQHKNESVDFMSFSRGFNQTTVDISGTPGQDQKATVTYFTGRYTQTDSWDGVNIIITAIRETATYTYYIPAESSPQGGGGDYSIWQNAAEKSGYASSTLGGLGNIVYSEYKGVERWVGKNGNYYNSSKVRMNGGYARSAQLAKSASMTYKIAGHSMTALYVGFTAVDFAYSDKSGGDYAKLVSAGIGVGLCFIPVIGPGLSIIYGIADSAGAFDGIYDYFDQ